MTSQPVAEPTAAPPGTLEAPAFQPVKNGQQAVRADWLTPKTLDEAMRLAEMMSKSSIVPKAYQGKPGDILISIQMGLEIGLSPMTAMQYIAVINGRPCMWGDAGLALVQGSGLLEYVTETWDAKTRTATCEMRRKGYPVSVRTFSMADAERKMVWMHDAQGNKKKVPLASKDLYQAYPERMCMWRARWFNMRDNFADVLRGLIGREEAIEMVPVDVEELPAPPAPVRASEQPAEEQPFVETAFSALLGQAIEAATHDAIEWTPEHHHALRLLTESAVKAGIEQTPAATALKVVSMLKALTAKKNEQGDTDEGIDAIHMLTAEGARKVAEVLRGTAAGS